MKKMFIILACILSLSMCMTACGNAVPGKKASAGGGVICLSVNPKIAVNYDADGNVTEVAARNDDGSRIITDYSGYEGKACKDVVSELVKAIGEAGYFVEKEDGTRRQITIELEEGSELPDDKFLEKVAVEVRETVNEENWVAPIKVKNDVSKEEADYTDESDDIDDESDDADDDVDDEADDTDDDVDDTDDDVDDTDDDVDDTDDDADDTDDDADDTDDDVDDTDDDVDDTDDDVDDTDDDVDDTDDADDAD